MTDLRKALKGERLYPREHPVRAELLRSFVRSGTHVVQKWGALAVRVGEKSLMLQDQVVFDDEDGLALCRHLHSDGVREIKLSAGMEESEAYDLFLAFSEALRRSRKDSDFVTMLWERDLPHVTIVVAQDPVTELPPEDLARVQELTAQYEQTPPDPDAKVPLLERVLPGDLKDHFAKEVSRELGRNLAVRLGLIVLADLRGVAPANPYRELAAGIFGDLLKASVVAGDLHGAQTLMQELERDPALSAAEKARFLSVLDEFRRASWVEEYVAEHRTPGQDLPLAAFLLALGPSVVPALIKILREDEAPHFHAVAETLAQIDPAPFLRVMAGGEAADVTVTLRLLERCGINVPKRALEDLLRRPSATVRVLAVRATSRSSYAGAAALLLPLLDDQDETVRIQVARSISVATGIDAFSRLAARVTDPEFNDRSLAERVATLEALASAGGRLAVNTIGSLLREKKWFRNTKLEETQTAAARALALIAGDEATAELRQGTRARFASVRSACKAALARRT
jgi:hypothetical protein